MRERLSDYQEKYGDLYNLEATPAESTTYRLAKHDKEKYPDIITAGKEGDTPYYTNSSHLPVEYTDNVFDALDIQDGLQTLYTSGTVFHAFLGEKLPDWQSAAMLVKKIAENYKLPYYTLSPTYSVCQTDGYISGEHFVCPVCGKNAEVYSRITGYYRPVQNWNDGKTQEYKNRKLYDTRHSVLHHMSEENPGQKEVQPQISNSNECKTTTQKMTYLFTTKTCPNCRMAKEILTSKEHTYVVIDAEENAELAQKYDIMQAPTLLIVDGKNTQKIVNASNIRKYVEEMSSKKEYINVLAE